MDMALFIHILGGGLGLVSGYIALFAAKGARLHRRSGMLFVYAMLTMSLTGAVVAALRATEGSVAAGLLTAYMVITALTTVRPGVAGLRWLNIGLMALALVIGVTGLAWGIQTLAKPKGMEDGIPAGAFFLFGMVALLAGLSDIRVIRFGALQGRQRLVRHLWRMGYALWIAAASFFLGQADEFPQALRIPALLAFPVLVVIVTTLYWLWRVRIRRPEPLHFKEKKMQLTAHSMRTLLLCLLAPAAVAMAQSSQDSPPPAAAAPAANPLSAFSKGMWGGVKTVLLRSAEKMPEESYGFKPTEAVRSYGQIIGHVADSQYTFCSRALDEPRPALKIEETKTSKNDLIAALKDALAYCDRAFDGMTDASGVQMVKLFGRDTPKMGVLTVHLVHSTEHYGNLVTYMRMKNIIPPSSEEGFRPTPKK